MRSVLPILFLAILPACDDEINRHRAPRLFAPQPIEAEYSSAVPKADPAQNPDLMAMALKLNEAIKLLDDCSVKHAHVNAYPTRVRTRSKGNKDKP